MSDHQPHPVVGKLQSPNFKTELKPLLHFWEREKTETYVAREMEAGFSCDMHFTHRHCPFPMALWFLACFLRTFLLFPQTLGHCLFWELLNWTFKSCTACGHRMAHRKWIETKQQPSMLPGPAVPGCSLVYFHFLWAILCPQAVHDFLFTYMQHQK